MSPVESHSPVLSRKNIANVNMALGCVYICDLLSSDCGRESIGKRLLKSDQSCFSDTSHIEATWSDSYTSDNVSVTRFSP